MKTIIFFLFSLLIVANVYSESLIVVNNYNAGEGSLRNIIENAAENSIIEFSPSFFTENGTNNSIILEESIVIKKSLIIKGLRDLTNQPFISVRVPITYEEDKTNASSFRLFTIEGHESMSPSISISDLIFKGGDISNNGDGDRNGGMLSINLAEVKIENVHFSEAKAKYGGALYNSDNLTTTTTINNCSFTKNCAEAGGAIYNEGNLNSTNSTISYNSALLNQYAQEDIYGYGGGIYSDGKGIVNLTGNIITNNDISGHYRDYYSSLSYGGGGGLYIIGNITLSNNTISYNKIYNFPKCDGGGIYASGNIIISNNIITHNEVIAYSEVSTSSKGGGIYLSGNTFFLNNIVSHNICSGESSYGSSSYGGGIYAIDEANIINNIISNNEVLAQNSRHGRLSSMHGGGIYCSNNVKIINNTILFNEGINYNHLSGGSKIEKSGSGIYADGGNIYNCIIWGNATIEPENFAFYLEQGEIQITDRCIVKNCLIGCPGYKRNNNDLIYSMTDGVDGNIIGEDKDPQFTNIDAEDYSLLKESPAINRGDNSWFPESIHTDLAGNERIFSGKNAGIIDMGAYEYQGNPSSLIDIQEKENIYIENDRLVIKSQSVGILKIYSLKGELYLQKNINAGTVIESIPKGIYIVQYNNTSLKLINH